MYLYKFFFLPVTHSCLIAYLKLNFFREIKLFCDDLLCTFFKLNFKDTKRLHLHLPTYIVLAIMHLYKSATKITIEMRKTNVQKQKSYRR